SAAGPGLVLVPPPKRARAVLPRWARRDVPPLRRGVRACLLREGAARGDRREPGAGGAMSRIVIAGGSGTLGRALTAALAGTEHEVVVLTRSPRPGRDLGRIRDVRWDGR